MRLHEELIGCEQLCFGRSSGPRVSPVRSCFPVGMAWASCCLDNLNFTGHLWQAESQLTPPGVRAPALWGGFPSP